MSVIKRDPLSIHALYSVFVNGKTYRRKPVGNLSLAEFELLSHSGDINANNVGSS